LPPAQWHDVRETKHPFDRVLAKVEGMSQVIGKALESVLAPQR